MAEEEIYKPSPMEREQIERRSEELEEALEELEKAVE